MTAVYFDRIDADDIRRRKLYRGDLYVYSPCSSTRALCQFARELAEEAFAPYDPREAQHHLPVEQYVQILARLKPAFIHHPRCKELVPAVLAELGCDLDQTCFDVPRLRTACAGDYLTSGLAYAFKPHRDTWYSPPLCQLNWWLPIYPIEAENGMAFHVSYWNKPLKNSSAEFNYQDWQEHGRKEAHNQVGQDFRRQSEALEPVERDPALYLTPPADGMFIFSAAHLHSTVPNTTQQTRLSIDFRTVHLGDLLECHGAPNVDSACTGTTIGDYLRASDLAHVPEDVARMYANALQPEALPVLAATQ
jgi:hypothetical protein